RARGPLIAGKGIPIGGLGRVAGGAGLFVLPDPAQPCRERRQRRRGLRALPRGKALDVHSRRAEARTPLDLRIGERLPQARGRVIGADEDAASFAKSLAGVWQEALRFGLDRVLQRASVHLDGVWDLAFERARKDR